MVHVVRSTGVGDRRIVGSGTGIVMVWYVVGMKPVGAGAGTCSG